MQVKVGVKKTLRGAGASVRCDEKVPDKGGDRCSSKATDKGGIGEYKKWCHIKVEW